MTEQHPLTEANIQNRQLESGRVADLLEAFNAAAAVIQRSSHSESQVFAAFKEQIASLNLIGVILTLDGDRQRLVIRALSQPTALLDRLKKLVGFEAEGYAFPATQVKLYHQILQTGRPQYLPDSSAIVIQFVPEDLNSIKDKFLESYGSLPAIVAPIQSRQEIIGVFNVIGAGLSPEHGPVIEALANHISIAIENARLFTQLHKAESQYRSLFESAIDGIVIIDPMTAKILSCNRKFIAITGQKEADLIGKPVNGLDPGQMNETIQRMLEIVRLRGQLDFELEITRPDQERRFVRVLAKLFTANEKPLIQGTFEDITERKLNENRLRETTASLQALIEAIPDGIIFKDGAGRWQIANTPSKEFLQLDGLDWYNKTGLELAVSLPQHADFFSRDTAGDEDTWQTNRRSVQHERLIDPEGNERVIDLRKVPIWDESNNRLGLVTIGRDITDQIQAEQALQLSEERFRSIFENAMIGIFRTTPEGRIVVANPALIAMLGYDSLEELQQRNLEEFGYASDQSRQRFKTMIQTKTQVKGLESIWLRKDGLELYVRETAQAIKTPDGQVLYYEGTVEDITQQKKLEISLRQRADELAALSETLVNITATQDLSVLLQTIIEQAARLLNAAGSSLFLREPHQDKIRLSVTYNAPTQLPGSTISYGEGVAGRVAQLKQPLLINNYPEWEDRIQQLDTLIPAATILGVPMTWRGELTGVIEVFHIDRQRTFTSQDIELLSLLGNQASIAVENARLLEAERTGRQRAEILRQAAIALADSLDLTQVLESILTQLEQVVSYESAAVYLFEDEKLRGVAARSFSNRGDVVAKEFPATDELFQELFLAGKSIFLDDASQDPRFHNLTGVNDIRGWMGIPLVAHGKMIGYLTCNHREAGVYRASDALLAEAFAYQAATAIENARLYEAQEQRTAELEAVRQASLSLTASLELSQVLDEILHTAINLLPEVSNSHIFLYNADGNGKLTFGAALWANGPQKKPFSEPRQDGLTYSVARMGHPILVPDISNHAIYEHAPRDWSGAIIGLPLIFGERVVGVMNISYRNPRQFPENELHMLRLLADQASVAIENARLFAQAATERRHLSLLYDIGREIVSSLDSDEILSRAIHLTCRALNGNIGEAFIYLPEEERLSVRAIFGSTDKTLAELDLNYGMRPGIGLAGWVAENRQPLFIPDLSQDHRWMPVPGLDDGSNSAITAPILSGQNLLGVLTVLHTDPEHFSSAHLELIGAICQEVGLALSNASRYQEVQRRLAEITFIQNLTQTFNQRLEPQVLLEEVAQQLGTQVGYPQVRIFLIEQSHLVLKATYGPRPEKKVFSLDKGVIGRAARTAQVVLIPDVAKDADYQACITESASELAVPIFRGSQVVGIINIETDRSKRLNDQDRDLLQVLAGQISVALENARLYEQVRLHAQELEQTVVQRTAELTELYELSQEIAFRLSFQELLALVMEHLQSAVLSDVVLGYLSNAGCRSVSVSTRRPLSETVVDKLRSIFLEAIDAQGGVRAPNCEIDLVQSPRYEAGQTPLKELASYIYAPVKIGGQLVGLLMVASQQKAAFGSEHTRLVNTFANQASTAAQRLTALLTAQQKHLESLVEHMPVGTVLLDNEFNLLVTNPIGLRILTTLNPEINDRIGDNLGPIPFRELLEHQDDLLPVDITLEGPPRQMFEAQIRRVGEPSQQWVLTLREVTRERENQDRIQSQERLATVGQLAAGIAHDFNNIMAAILVYADLLRNEPDIPIDSQDKLVIIEEQVQRAASLIRQILDFSRRSIMEQSALDILPFVKELDKMLGRILPETISLELTYQPGEYWVNADPTRLQQVFMNLALNARDAMPDGGLLQFGLAGYELPTGDSPPVPNMPAGAWIRIQITDNGMGIPTDVMQHIFEPFFTTKPVGQGTGLGLAQVYGIIRHHEGYIDVKSLPGEGTTFSIYLPSLHHPPALPTISDTPQEMVGQGETILVVEDDEITREAIYALLQARQYDVLTAPNGQQALEIYQQEKGRITLIISDVVMPIMGGVELYTHLRKNFGDIKMLFITGHPLEGNYQQLLEKGSVHWLQKPFSVQKFNETVWSLLKDEPHPDASSSRAALLDSP